jgi:RNA polymerase sigma-70 factor (ECF subfamily)
VINAADLGDDDIVSRAEALILPEQDVGSRASAREPLSSTPGEAVLRDRADPVRLRTMVTEHFDFVWRSLVRLGVPRRDAEDALQQVFLVAARKVDLIEPGRERAFLFATALRLASRARRTLLRRREVLDGVAREQADPSASVDERIDETRARAVALEILEAMPLDLRAVFVLFELEQMTMVEIAKLLELPAGTVASRLRRARELFQASVRRLSARGRAT